MCASGELSHGQIFDTIVRLVDKSVITRDDAAAGEEGGQPTRYKMLDTIREFGAERLADSGTVAGVRNRFIARYLSMARYFDEHVVDDDQLDRLRELRREHANLRAALEYTLDATESESSRYADGAELAIALYGYWHMSGLLREGKYWLDKVLERFPDPSSAQRGWALVVRGYLGAMQGEANEAVRDCHAGTEIGLKRADLPARRARLHVPDARADDRRPLRRGARGRRPRRAAAADAQRPRRAAHPRRAPGARGQPVGRSWRARCTTPSR